MKDADMPLTGILSECMRIEGMSVPRTFDNQAIKEMRRRKRISVFGG